MATPGFSEDLPAALKSIIEEAHRNQPSSTGLNEIRPVWKDYVARVSSEIPGVTIEGAGETVYLGHLSPGCQACKEGTWDCIFTTMRCNLNCEFCYSPHAIPEDYVGSAFGADCQQIAEAHDRTHITGISFSGGEPFLEINRLVDWVGWFKRRYPDKYYWVYTNGLLACPERLKRLGELGLDEVRFNMAATGYQHPVVMKNLEAAVAFIPWVTVEIPAIPEESTQLLASLAAWAAVGVKCINLHELMYEPGTNSTTMPGLRRPFITADGHRSQINPNSRQVTLAVMQSVCRQELPLSVNDCSLQSKLRQLRGRRRSLAPILKSPYEVLVGEDQLESCAAFRGEEVLFFPTDRLSQMRQDYPDHNLVRLVRTAPMSPYDRGRWVAVEAL